MYANVTNYFTEIVYTTRDKEQPKRITQMCKQYPHPDQYDLTLRTSMLWLLQLANVSKAIANKDRDKT